MKKISSCQECGRTVYTNDIDLCKRCHQEVGVSYLQNQEIIEEDEDDMPNMEDLGIEESSEETAEAAPEEPKAEEPKKADE